MGVDTDTMLCWLTSRKKACVGFSCRRRLGGRRGAVREAPPTCLQVRASCGVFVPDDLDQLAHVHVIWNQELGLVQNRQLFLSLISLNDYLQTGSDASADRKQCTRQSGLWVRVWTKDLTGILLGCCSRICWTSLQRSAGEKKKTCLSWSSG